MNHAKTFATRVLIMPTIRLMKNWGRDGRVYWGRHWGYLLCWRGTSTTQNSTSNRRRHFSRLTRNCMDEAGGLRSGFGGLGAAGRNSHRISNFVVFDPARCYIRDIMLHPFPRSRPNPAASGVLLYIRTKCPTEIT